jgi:outer membrane lipoprotein-sorting protein
MFDVRCLFLAKSQPTIAPFNRIILVFVLVLMLGACTTLKRTTPAPPEGDASPAANALLRRLERLNSGLKTFKAVGRIRLQNPEGVQHARAMWAGFENSKMRLETLGPSGQPLASFAYDGKKFYLISHPDNRFYSKPGRGNGLEKIIHLPLKISESLNLLAGRMPRSNDYGFAGLLNDAPPGFQILIVKQRSKGNAYDKIYCDMRTESIQRVEAYDEKGALRFRAEFEALQRIGGFRVPLRVSIADGEGHRLDLSIDRFWPNAPVSDSLFVLSKPSL